MKRMVCVIGVLLLGTTLCATSSNAASERLLALDLFLLKPAQMEMLMKLTAPQPQVRMERFGTLTLRPVPAKPQEQLSPEQAMMRLSLMAEKMTIDPAVGLPESMYGSAASGGSGEEGSGDGKPNLQQVRLQLQLTADKLIVDPAVGLSESFYQPSAMPQASPTAAQRTACGADAKCASLRNSGMDRVSGNRFENGPDDRAYQGGGAMGGDRSSLKSSVMQELRMRALRSPVSSPDSPYDDVN